MKKLNRTIQPECLLRYDHTIQKWDDVTSIDKNLIWDKLYEIQGHFCAYCESYINKNNHHIEHFARKSSNKELTFCWENLFGSCNKNNNCGHYKDHGAGDYVLRNLIKPDESNPEEYLRFTFSGRVQAKENLSQDKLTKANETIRVFNLNNELLVQSRSEVIKSNLLIFNELRYFFEENGINEQDKCEMIDQELLEIKLRKANPYQTAVKSVFLDGLLP